MLKFTLGDTSVIKHIPSRVVRRDLLMLGTYLYILDGGAQLFIEIERTYTYEEPGEYGLLEELVDELIKEAMTI